jgi:hypothetical protein
MFLKKKLDRPWRLPSTVNSNELSAPGICTCNCVNGAPDIVVLRSVKFAPGERPITLLYENGKVTVTRVGVVPEFTVPFTAISIRSVR